MIVFALYNLKGGVGKTAAATNLAYLSASDGYKTLIWDLDPQGPASFYFNVKALNKNETKKLFAEELDIKKAIQNSAYNNLNIIAADISARNIDFMLKDAKHSKRKLKDLLGNLKGYDVVFLDCSPGISLMHENIFNAADKILMPNIPTTLSINSFETVKEYFNNNELDKSKLKCFFSMVDHRKNLHHEVMQRFYNDKLFLKSYIPYLSDIEKMGINKQPLFEFANNSYAAKCFRDLWNEVKKVCL